MVVNLLLNSAVDHFKNAEQSVEATELRVDETNLILRVNEKADFNSRVHQNSTISEHNLIRKEYHGGWSHLSIPPNAS